MLTTEEQELLLRIEKLIARRILDIINKECIRYSDAFNAAFDPHAGFSRELELKRADGAVAVVKYEALHHLRELVLSAMREPPAPSSPA